jgi:membrane-associated phospholipid phosphatase
MWQTFGLAAAGTAVIIALMIWVDAWEIGLMPPRGTPGLWPFRVLTDFGKDAYVLWLLFTTLIVSALLVPRSRDSTRARLLGFAARAGYLFLSVLVSVLIAEMLKWGIGRGRPFVGGKANAFNLMPFAGSEAYFSLPSAHVVTAFALASAMAMVWPRARVVMFAYAVMIAITRLVLLAHHPSDVVAGAVVGMVGAMWVHYWFAARNIGFAIGQDS